MTFYVGIVIRAATNSYFHYRSIYDFVDSSNNVRAPKMAQIDKNANYKFLKVKFSYCL